MSRLAAVSLALTVLGISGCVDRPTRMFAAADRAMAVDDFDQAAHLYREVTIQAPATDLAARAQFELARIYYLRRRNVAAAKESLLKVLRSSTPNLEQEAKLMLARLYTEDLAEPENAIALYESVLGDDLEEVVRRDTLMNLAHCYYTTGALERSAETYRQTLRLPYHPDADQAYMRLANLAWLTGGAAESLRLVKELSHLTADREHRLSAAVQQIEQLIALDRFVEAERELTTATDIFPEASELASLRHRMAMIRDDQRELGDGETLLVEQQKKIQWSASRRRVARGR